MKKSRLILVLLVFVVFSGHINANTIKIIVKVQNEIITNVDIENEKKYLLFLNPKLEQLDRIRFNDIAKNSLITEIVKKKELENFYDLNKTNNIIDTIEKNFLKTRNIKNKDQFIQILKDKNLDYKMFKTKLQTEALWNQLVYKKYGKNIKINKENLKKNILEQSKNMKKKYEYNLSEIYFNESVSESLEDTLIKLSKSIKDIGFENTANIYSISNTSKNGGLIGWVNELQISELLKENIVKLNNNEIFA